MKSVLIKKQLQAVTRCTNMGIFSIGICTLPSLGGGEAALNAILADKNAITFNAAGVDDYTKRANGNNETDSKSEKNINAFILTSNPLNNLQNNNFTLLGLLMPDVKGNRIYLFHKDFASTINGGHSIDNIIKNFGVSNPNQYKN